jgi:hypothetical protein
MAIHDFLLQNPELSLIASGIGGMVLTVVTGWIKNRIQNKQGTFRYYVEHKLVAISTQDPVFGSVVVTWNNAPVSNLYLSTITLKNESLNDYEKVAIQTYTDNTRLLQERTQIEGAPKILEWTDHYKQLIHVEPGAAPTDQVWKLYHGQREHIIPVMNRGQVIKLSYLNSANNVDVGPAIWLSAHQKGVRLNFKPPQPEVLGVAQPIAAFVGVLLGVAVLVVLVSQFSNLWAVTIASMTYGLVAQVPGALAVKLYRKIRDMIGG